LRDPGLSPLEQVSLRHPKIVPEEEEVSKRK